MYREHTIKGFTLLEIVIVVALVGIIASISTVALKNMYQSSALRAGGSEVYRALTDAQSSTLASDGDMVYGVRIASTSVTRFEGPTYSAGSATNKTYRFEGGVNATGTLISSGRNFVFQRLTGGTSATGTVYIRNADGTGTTTVTIHGSGLIEND